MNELMLVIEVTVMFFLRIGFPVLALIILGVVVDRWQSRREAEVRSYYETHSIPAQQH
jgi:hypothetical protein